MDPTRIPVLPAPCLAGEESAAADGQEWCGGYLNSLILYIFTSFPLLFTISIAASPAQVGQALLPVLRAYERQRSVTGPSIGCNIGAPVLRDSIKLAFSAKYHFAGRSASSISINRGLCFNPSACWIMVS